MPLLFIQDQRQMLPPQYSFDNIIFPPPHLEWTALSTVHLEVFIDFIHSYSGKLVICVSEYTVDSFKVWTSLSFHKCWKKVTAYHASGSYVRC